VDDNVTCISSIACKMLLMIRSHVPTVDSAIFVAHSCQWQQHIRYVGRFCQASHLRPGALRMAAMYTYVDGSLVWLLLPCQSKDTETFDLSREGGWEALFEYTCSALRVTSSWVIVYSTLGEMLCLQQQDD